MDTEDWCAAVHLSHRESDMTEQQQNIALNLTWPFGDQNILRIKPPYISANKTRLLLSAPSTHVESGQLGVGQDRWTCLLQ